MPSSPSHNIGTLGFSNLARCHIAFARARSLVPTALMTVALRATMRILHIIKVTTFLAILQLRWEATLDAATIVFSVLVVASFVALLPFKTSLRFSSLLISQQLLLFFF